MVFKTIYCDHCGRMIGEMTDYPDTEVGIIESIKADLCAECFDELEGIIKDFVTKGSAEY